MAERTTAFKDIKGNLHPSEEEANRSSARYLIHELGTNSNYYDGSGFQVSGFQVTGWKWKELRDALNRL